METKRPYHRTKADWAAATAREKQQAADDLQRVPPSDWREARGRSRALETIRAEIRKFDRMAQRFRAQGV